jgi:Recombination endonuclease VII.
MKPNPTYIRGAKLAAQEDERLNPTKRKCKTCRVERPFHLFKDRIERGKRRLSCVYCCKGKKYGLTGPEVLELLLSQDYCCGLCGIRDGMTLHIDHNHRTGKVRGLLCAKCNHFISIFDNASPGWLEKAQLWVLNRGQE